MNNRSALAILAALPLLLAGTAAQATTVSANTGSLGADGRSTSKTVPAVLDLVGSLATALRAP